jgi:hypothetical protein
MKRKSGISARLANTRARADDRALVKRLVIVARNVNSTNRGCSGRQRASVCPRSSFRRSMRRVNSTPVTSHSAASTCSRP